VASLIVYDVISILMAGCRCLAFLIYKYPCQAAEHNWLDNLRSLAAAPVAAAHLLTLRGGSFGNRSVIVLWPNHENNEPLFSHHTAHNARSRTSGNRIIKHKRCAPQSRFLECLALCLNVDQQIFMMRSSTDGSARRIFL
jgi:hypothetical protein